MSGSQSQSTPTPVETHSESVVEQDGAKINKSTITRTGGFDTTPEEIAVEVVFIPESNTEQQTATVVFTVDEQGVASVDTVESDANLTPPQKFIPVAFTARQITSLPSVDRVEGVPRLKFIQEFLCDEGAVNDNSATQQAQESTNAQAPANEGSPTNEDVGQDEENTTGTQNGVGTNQATSSTSSTESAESPSGVESTTTDASQMTEASSPEDDQHTSNGESPQTGETEHNDGDEPEGERSEPSPTQQARREADVEGWVLREMDKENVIGETLVNSSGNSIAVWDITAESEQDDYAVIFYPKDGDEVQEGCSTEEQAVNITKEWLHDPPTADSANPE